MSDKWRMANPVGLFWEAFTDAWKDDEPILILGWGMILFSFVGLLLMPVVWLIATIVKGLL